MTSKIKAVRSRPEFTALHRQGLGLTNGIVRVAFTELRVGQMPLGHRSRAGIRTVSLPRSFIPDLQRHLD